MKINGKAIAMTVAGLLLALSPLAHGSGANPEKTGPSVKCTGINSCKGKSSCKSANNACKAQNSCKGHGWMETSTVQECTDKGGKVLQEK